MGIGVLFLLFIVIAAITFKGSGDFEDKHTEFVVQFMNELSSEWRIGDVYPKLTNVMIQQSETQEGKRFLNMFRRLGSIKTINDLELQNYFSGTDGNRGVFVFKAEFENGFGLVTLTVLEVDGKPQVQAININITETPLFNSQSSKFDT